jgi:hypothetical protein
VDEVLVDERGQGDGDTYGHRRRERQAAAREQRRHRAQDRQHVEPQRSLRPAAVALADRRLGDTEADAANQHGVEPIAPRERPQSVPVHDLKVLRRWAGRLVPEDEPPSFLRPNA